MGVGEFFGGKMSEREKMLAGQLYNHYDKQLTTERKEIAEKFLHIMAPESWINSRNYYQQCWEKLVIM